MLEKLDFAGNYRIRMLDEAINLPVTIRPTRLYVFDCLVFHSVSR